MLNRRDYSNVERLLRGARLPDGATVESHRELREELVAAHELISQVIAQLDKTSACFDLISEVAGEDQGSGHPEVFPQRNSMEAFFFDDLVAHIANDLSQVLTAQGCSKLDTAYSHSRITGFFSRFVKKGILERLEPGCYGLTKLGLDVFMERKNRRIA